VLIVATSVVMADEAAEPETGTAPDRVEAAADSKLASAVLRIELTALEPIALPVVTEEVPTAPVAEAAGTLSAPVAVAGACTCPSSIWLTTLDCLFARTIVTLLLTWPIV